MARKMSNKTYLVSWAVETYYQIEVPGDISEEQVIENFKNNKYEGFEMTQIGTPQITAEGLTIDAITQYQVN